MTPAEVAIVRRMAQHARRLAKLAANEAKIAGELGRTRRSQDFTNTTAGQLRRARALEALIAAAVENCLPRLRCCIRCRLTWIPPLNIDAADPTEDKRGCLLCELEASAKKCRICGCTDDMPCVTPLGPCGWVEPDLCDRCEIVT